MHKFVIPGKLMKIIKTAIIVATAITLLTACGGGGGLTGIIAKDGSSGTTSTAAPGTSLASPEIINGIVVPPNPGSAKDATLAGVDVDNNGIRDEIDRWIATKYGDKPGALEPIRMVARVKQKLMMANPTTEAEARAIVYESIDVGVCAATKFVSEGITPGKIFNESMIRTYNTIERINARKKVFSLTGMILRDADETTIICQY